MRHLQHNQLFTRQLVLLVFVVLVALEACGDEPNSLTDAELRPAERLILAHYMPWYAAKPHSSHWGWHWTMNHFDPDELNPDQSKQDQFNLSERKSGVGERRAIASHYYPLIGPYDSGDPDVIEYHLLTMKLAGIDGVIVDWYGLTNLHDYASLHRNTGKLVEQAKRLGMRVVICYEDQTIPALEKAGRLLAKDRVRHAIQELHWLAKHWFQERHYVRLEGKPVLLSFGHAGLTNDEWSACLNGLAEPVSYFSEHMRRNGAVGGFDWPIPQRGLEQTNTFVHKMGAWSDAIPVAFPRFHDVYAEAGLHDSYGRIDDEAGATLRQSLTLALKSDAKIIQIATWNDWGEGTQIEPSREYGYRDLELIAKLRQKTSDGFDLGSAETLQLPLRLYKARRNASDTDIERLSLISHQLASGQVEAARQGLESLATAP